MDLLAKGLKHCLHALEALLWWAPYFTGFYRFVSTFYLASDAIGPFIVYGYVHYQRSYGGNDTEHTGCMWHTKTQVLGQNKNKWWRVYNWVLSIWSVMVTVQMRISHIVDVCLNERKTWTVPLVKSFFQKVIKELLKHTHYSHVMIYETINNTKAAWHTGVSEWIMNALRINTMLSFRV